MAAESFREGFIEPPLIKQLQNILKQYPDDGQILKELIQNAEDAGAKTVKFLYDHNQYPLDKGTLYHPGLATYQGPALYAYNDAVFSDDDWKGIRMIQDSVKAKDPMKVGRFGLGFKSVFHMTDLPGIISGKQVGFLDPRQLFFKKKKTVKQGDVKWEDESETSSFAWDLSSGLLRKHPNQFKPFMHDIFNTTEKTFDKGNFNGTVFRFPLRKEKSDISKTIYNDKKISNLMQLLEKEGHFLLLFLKHLERIEFFELFPGKKTPELKLSVAVSSSKRTKSLEIRQRFVERIKHIQQQKSAVPNAEFCNYLLETKLYNSNGDLCEPEPKRWAVTQYYGGGKVQSDISVLASKSQNIPLVGVALPLDVNVTGRLAPSGSVFCVLPMPLGSDNETGLNLHVNGYFAVDHNRRHLKWPAKHQSVEHSTDEDLMWNNSLLKYVIPCAMNELLQYAITLNRQDIISDEQVYAIFPSKATLKDQWLPLLDIFREKAEEATCLYSASTEMWIKPREAYLINSKDADFQDTIKTLLSNGRVPFCEPPRHVIAMLQESVKYVTPAMIRVQVEKQVSNLTKIQKRDMIQYFYHISNTTDLMNLQLLELLDGTYRKFEKRTRNNVLYLETEECPRNLFPSGVENIVVNYKPIDEMYEILEIIALSGKTQLTTLQPNIVAQLLHHVFEGIATYTPNSPPLYISQDWLKRLWSFINKFNMNLAEFIGIPIMPVSSQKWGSVSTSIPYIVDKSTERSLSDIKLSSGILEKIGCIVVREWKNVAGRISWERIGSYVSPPTIKGMIDALMKDKPNGGLFEKIDNLNENEKIILRNAIGKCDLDLYQKTFLKGLPLIKCYKTNDNLKESWCPFTSIKCLADLDDYNIPLQYKIGKWKENEGFASKLGADNVSQTAVLQQFIFPTLNEQFYKHKCIQEVMEKVLKNLDQHRFHEPNFLQYVENVAFLTNRKKKLLKPSEVLDPSDEYLKIFQVLDVFPCGKFSDRQSLDKLHGIFRKVSEHDVHELVKYLNNSFKITNQMCTQGEKLLQFLSNKDAKFMSNDTLLQIRKMKWLPAKVDRPKYYPEKVGWYGRENVLYSPEDIVSAEYENVVGSVKPVLARSLKRLNHGLIDGLKLNKLPSTKCIVSHLENIRSVCTQFKMKDKPQVTILMKEIYQMLDENMAFTEVQRLLTNSGSWIWNGDTFTSGAHVVLEKAAVDLNPYVSCLPQEYMEFSEFFLRLKMQQTVKLTDVLMMINDYHKKKTATVEETKRDLNKCLDILRTLNDSRYVFPEHTPLPILSSDDTLEMASFENCVYCDQEKKAIDFDDVSLDDGEELYVVHEIIPPLIAKGIGVPSLMSKYLDPEPIAYGQSEPLTRRLSRLLDDYKDGSSVLKELLQNADDAEANKVAFIYDRRDFRSSSTSLIDKKMKELQGPALLCYNDAQFSDEDFENIVKLSGETKKEKLDKVGRFGLGFNAVYNLTDAPSFISNHSVVMLDPHVKYLGDAVKNASQPGIRLEFTKHGNRIKRFKDQFKPFENIMGVDIQNSQHYNGTLFRLPLRTPKQAETSLISSKSYTKKDIQELFALFQKNAKNLLLFTQNVIEIDFYEIPEGGQQTVPCGHLQKSLVQLLHSVNSSTSNIDWNDELRILKHAHMVLRNETPKRSSYIMRTKVKLNNGEMFAIGSSEINYWLISAVVGNGESRKYAREQRDLLPVGGIAVELKQNKMNQYYPLLLKSNGKFDGQVFSFLPLPIKSELPFHINGYFSVESNRRQLCAQQFSEKSDSRAHWNSLLMKDAVKEAYVQALCDMVSHKRMFPLLKKYILEMFPISVLKTLEGKMNSMFTFTEAFYTSMCERPLDILPSISTWWSFSKIRVLNPRLRNIMSNELGNIGDMIFKTCADYFANQSTYGFVDLPGEVLDQMLSIDCIREVVKNKIITLQYFYSSILLDSETEYKHEHVHRLIIYGLLESENKVDNILREKKCVPVAGTKRFLQPCELVDPNGPLRDLYDDDINPFPIWLLQNNNPKEISANMRKRIRVALENLGMRVSYLPDDELICQARTVQLLSKRMGTKRCICILQLLNNKQNGSYVHYNVFEAMKRVLFLPIAEKPQNWIFPWKNVEHGGEFILIDAAYSESQSRLIGCSEFVARFPLSDSLNLQKHLGYGKRQISLPQVEKQLHSIVSIVKESDSHLLGSIERIMDEIYRYLDSKAKEPQFRAYIHQNYQTEELILMKYSVQGFRRTDTRLVFVTPEHCACVRFDGEPYLFSLPHDFSSKYKTLVQALEIKDTFPVVSLIQALKNIAQEKKRLLLNGDTLTIVRNIVAMLAMKFTYDTSTLFDMYEPISFDMYEPIYLPDSNGVMINSVNLCFNNCPWVKRIDKHFLHQSIPFGEAEILGVKTFRKEILSKFQSGIPFGQSEKLVNRIRRILEGYPCDKEIMNELLQNADDSGATEVHFILDPRKHPDEKLFDPMWKPLQGPALLVYNDQPFTKRDLEGIQNLGEGGKSNDPLTTGKYGVGFNCVYHLTDTPTFLTTIKEVGQTLVAFDPQCKYVPGSELHNPGQMWNNVEELQQTFPDVFRCYQLPIETEGGTLFRFPLRTKSAKSEISNNSMSAEKIMELFKTFSESIAESLLFVNNVRKVTLSKLNKYGRIEIVDKAELNMCNESQQQKDMFDGEVKCAAQFVTAGKMENIQPINTAYEVDIEHKNEVKKWLVVQQIGIESETDFNDISEQYRKKKATMLPRGGVAYLLSTTTIIGNEAKKYNTATQRGKKGKKHAAAKIVEIKSNNNEQQHRLFCFLPLPVKIPYPVHVNGYFVLDHESRRDLWHDENENCLNVMWNKLIMQKVVAPCYNKVMEYVKDNIRQEGQFYDLKVKVQELIDIFPHETQEDVYMKYLERSIFKHMMLHKTELLPVLLRKSIWEYDEREPNSQIVDLHWYPLCSDENKIAYFDNLNIQLAPNTTHGYSTVIERQQREQEQQGKQIQYIRNVLQNCRFPITLANDTVFRKIETFAYESNQTVEHIAENMSPENVLKFLILKADDLKFPIGVQQSVFVSKSALLALFYFVKEYLHNNLENVPLLLKADGVVDMFKTGQTCLLSNYSDLMDKRSDLFADKLYLTSGIEGIDAYLKPLTCENLAPILEDQLSKLEYYGEKKHILLNTQDEPHNRWLLRLWGFINNQCNDGKTDKNHVSFMQKIKPLEKWCILPVKRITYELWPLCNILQLVNLQSVNDRDQPIAEILKKVAFPQAYIPHSGTRYGDKSAMINIIGKIVSNLSIPDRVLVAFGNAISKIEIDFFKLTPEESSRLLKYFSDSIDMLSESVPDAKAILVKLPLYETQSGIRLSLSNTQVRYYTMPASIPSLEGWTPNNQNVYLKHNSSLDDLHKFVCVSQLNVEETYLHHILDYFSLLSDERRDKHLYFLKTLIENPQHCLEARHEQQLLDKMKSTPMLRTTSGTLLTASKFYDDTVPLFREFESNFSVSPYDGPEWKSFLCKIGLVHKLNGELVLKYAKNIEENSGSLEDLLDKSMLLYKTIIKNKNRDILQQIAPSLKRIAFIPSEQISENLLALCDPHTENGKFVKFYQSTLSQNSEVLWTQCPILVSWVDPGDDICDLLGIKRQPTLQEIVKNMRTVIQVQILSKILFASVSYKLICFLQATFRRIMHDHKEKNVSELTNMRCIAINDGTQFVYPTQVTISFPDEKIKEHVTPYLCKIPDEFWEYRTLLLNIGATAKPTVQQYANVLRDIYDKIENETSLHGSESYAAVYALQGLFELAWVDDSISTLDQLHLLSDENCLVCSQKLVFIDQPRLRHRIKNLDYTWVSNEKEIGKSQMVQNALRKLKLEVKPVFLSTIVSENVDAPSEKLEKTMKCVGWEERLSSKEFANGIVRIMRSSDNELCISRNEEGDAQDLKLVQSLGIIKVYELEKVNTYLVHNSQRLPNSDSELSYFIQNEPEEPEEPETIKILLSADSLAGDLASLCTTMCFIINKQLKHKLQSLRSIMLLNLILQCSVDNIERLLDNQNVNPYEVYTDFEITQSRLPSPGQYVPLEFHHLLQQCIELLNVGEYVAFEVSDSLDAKMGEEIETDDDGDNENAVYRYARVTKVLKTGGSYCNYYYEIDLGSDDDEKVKVHASELYRFERKPKSSGPVVVSTHTDEDVPDASNVPRAEGNFSQIKSQITETLDEAWKLEDVVKRRIIKRLFLQWHPDKNPDCIELATEVFKFIQNEIERLEKGLGRSEVDGTSRSYNYNQFFGRRARSHRHWSNQFEDRDNYSGGSSHYTPPRHMGKNPQPDEAKRWLKQAEYDLLAVRNDLEPHFNEWACFKAHQAAEKGLKATQFAYDSGLKDNQHALPSLCDAIGDLECINWARELECLVKSSAAMRYPDRHYGGQTPHDAYSDSTAQTVKTLASQILEKCQAFLISQRR